MSEEDQQNGGLGDAGNAQSDDSANPTGAGNDPTKQKYTTGTKGKFLIIPPHPDTTFDDTEFLELLEGSLSLSIAEKVRVADAIPRLKQQQIDDLIRIFNEEKERFAELAKEAGDKVQELKDRRERELDMASTKEKEEEEADDEAAEAERLKRDLGL